MMGKYEVSAFIDEYSDNLEEQVAALKRYGIKYVELRHCGGKNVAEFDETDKTAIKKAFDEHGIKVSSIGSPIGKIAIDCNIKAHLDLAKQVFETANYFQAKYVRIFSFYLPKDKKAETFKGKTVDFLGELVNLSGEYGITLCHENEAGIYGESPARCFELLEEFNGKMKCVFDMGNFVLDGYKPFPDAYNLLKKHIAYFHIKDALYKGAVVPAGKGEASLKEILEGYKKDAKESVFVTLEPHLQTFAGLNTLIGKTFENPYKFASPQAAFDEDVKEFYKILREIND